MPDAVLFRCPLCKSIAKAKINSAYKKNRIFTCLVAFVMVPISSICAGMAPVSFSPIVFVAVYISAVLVPVIRGHHSMDFSRMDGE